jgi:hypothetical protein
LQLLDNLSYLASLLLLANLSWDINVELLFYLKCRKSSTATINPHIKRSNKSFLVVSPPSRPFLLWTLYGDWHLTFIIRCITTTDRPTSVDLSITHVGITNEEMAHGYMLIKANEEMGEAGRVLFG